MADNKNLGERFSNDQYLTYNQVAVELKTTLIDGIWRGVLEYREKFTLPLTIRTVDKNRFKVVLTPKITEKINLIERKLNKLLINYSTFVQNDDYKQEFGLIQAKNIISNIAQVYNVETSESFYQQLVTNHTSSLTPSEMILLDYYRAIKYIQNNVEAPLDQNFIAGLADIFDATDGQQYIYRTEEVKDQSQKALINKLFVAAPVNLIEDMVEDLLDFMQVSSASMFVKFVAIFFYFSYIKPFNYHSEEMALLFAKAFLQRHDLETVAPMLNLEVIHDELKDTLDDTMLEVKKSNDLTYLVTFFADVFLTQINQFDDLVVDIRKRMIIEERYQEEIRSTAPSLKTNENVGETETKVEQQSLNLDEDVEQSEDLQVSTPKPVVITGEVNPTYENPSTVVHKQDEGVKLDTWMDVALPKVPVGLSEEDAQKIETHLKEMDPSLSKLEAYFYARHCTVGKYYTIAQFKEVTSCAYETARTSMDHLANSGYYRKEKFKNKFLYTPIKR